MSSRALRVALIVLLISLFSIACGQANTPQPEEPQATEPTEAPTEPPPTEAPADEAGDESASAETEAEPTEAADETEMSGDDSMMGGTFRFSVADDVTFHPIHGTDRPSAFANKFIFGTLTRVDENLEPVGLLAKDWEVSDDGLTWTFNLYDNVTWHDGEPFTAEDVKFTLDLLKDPDAGWRYRSNLGPINSVDVVDDYTVQINMDAPFSPLAAHLAYYGYILPQHLLADDALENEDFNLRQPVGTGPYKVAEYERGSFIRLEPHTDFHLDGPFFDEVVIKILPDQDTVAAQLLSNELDYHDITPGRHLTALETQDHIKIASNPATRYNHAMVDNENPLFEDPRMRLALSYALDREKMIESVMLGQADLPIATIPKAVGWAYAEELGTIPYDPDRSKALLEEMGYTMGEQFWEKDGEPLTFTISADNVDVARRESAVIAHQMWRDLGIDAKLEVMDWSTWLAERFRTIPSVTNGYWSHPTDPDLSSYFACEGSINYYHYCNEEVNQLFEEATQTFDREERRALYKEIQRIMLEEDPPLIVYYYLRETVAMNKNLQGVPNLEIRDALEWVNEWHFAAQ